MTFNIQGKSISNFWWQKPEAQKLANELRLIFYAKQNSGTLANRETHKNLAENCLDHISVVMITSRTEYFCCLTKILDHIGKSLENI